MAEQVELRGTVLSTRRIRGEWGAAALDTGDGEARATGDIGHLSRGDDVVAVGRWVASKWDRSGREFRARAVMPVALMPALRDIEAVTDRFQPRRPARGAVLGLAIKLGAEAAAVMRENPFLPVVDPEREVKGWGYGSAAQYADLVGIPADDPVRAVAAVTHLWPQLADGSVVVSRDRLESRVTTAAGIDSTAARLWVDAVVQDGRLEPMGPHQVAWRSAAQAERAIARMMRERMEAA